MAAAERHQLAHDRLEHNSHESSERSPRRERASAHTKGQRRRATGKGDGPTYRIDEPGEKIPVGVPRPQQPNRAIGNNMGRHKPRPVIAAAQPRRPIAQILRPNLPELPEPDIVAAVPPAVLLPTPRRPPKDVLERHRKVGPQVAHPRTPRIARRLPPPQMPPQQHDSLNQPIRSAQAVFERAILPRAREERSPALDHPRVGHRAPQHRLVPPQIELARAARAAEVFAQPAVVLAREAGVARRADEEDGCGGVEAGEAGGCEEVDEWRGGGGELCCGGLLVSSLFVSWFLFFFFFFPAAWRCWEGSTQARGETPRLRRSIRCLVAAIRTFRGVEGRRRCHGFGRAEMRGVDVADDGWCRSLQSQRHGTSPWSLDWI